jgi:hypothetical protein
MTIRPLLALGALVSVAVASCASPAPQADPAPTPAPPAAVQAPAAPQAPSPRPGDTRPEISVEDLRLRIGLLAHDSMRGRETGSREKEQAGDYLAREAERLGLLPGGDNGTFFQSVPLERTVTRVQAERTPPGSGASPRPAGSDEVLFVSGLGGLPDTRRTSGDGALVFGGYFFDPTIAPGTLTFEQVSGAAVIVFLDAAPGVGDPSELAPRMELAALFGPQSPASAILFVADGDLEDFWDYAVDVALKGAVSLRGGDEPGDAPPFFLLAPGALEEILGVPVSEARTPRTGLGSFRFTLERETAPYDGRNVIAILPGAHPEFHQEYMTLGAHYDHVGVGTPVDGDSIYNGADDNASGTAAILEVAELLAHRSGEDRPGRSVLFIWHAAEESGLLGSEHFTDNPTVSRDRMVAHINLDMVGRNHPDSIFLVGTRRLSTEYGALVEEANANLSRPFVLDYTYDEPGHPEQLYCRSDHWNFARWGIPVAKIGSGLHDDYHKPSDTVEKIEFEKVARVAAFAAEITLRVANAPAPPRIDGPVPDPAAPCQG